MASAPTGSSDPTPKLGPKDFWRWFNTAPDKRSHSWAQSFRRGSYSYKRFVTALSLAIGARLIYEEEKKKPFLLKPFVVCPAEEYKLQIYSNFVFFVSPEIEGGNKCLLGLMQPG